MSDGVSSSYSEFVFKSRYARWIESENRRENWDETVDRYINFFAPRIPEAFREKTVRELRSAILNFEVMPSMRAMMTAGKALERDEAAGYNCSFIAVDDPRAFDEAMYLSMCGVGVGFSVESRLVEKLPTIAENFHDSPSATLIVRDSRIGWATSFKELIALLYAGQVPRWDLSRLRPAGAPLKTFGGRASGPEPLNSLFEFAVRLFRSAAGRKLTSIECHDLLCKIADVVVSGGVRRSAMISLSDLNDDLMRGAKVGDFGKANPQRYLANNSAVYDGKPDIGVFMDEWKALFDSKSGERGIFNRAAAVEAVKSGGRRKWEGIQFGLNPCSEIILRPNQFCNLTEVVCRQGDTEESLGRKVRAAAILGTLQSTLTNFRYLRKVWKKNTEDERLLGVGLGGIMDCPLTNNPDPAMLIRLKKIAVDTNAEWAAKLGINPSAAVTCVKPSGTVSQFVNCASGIHPRFARHYVRAVRNDRKDPVTAFLKAAGVPHEVDVAKPDHVDVFYFPMEAPITSVTRTELSAVAQLELYLVYKKYWCEHNVSNTVYVRDHEWLQVAAWIHDHFNEVCGIAFLPYDNGNYMQAPYREITREEYQTMILKFPRIDWYDLTKFETEDRTTSARELSCSAGHCEI